MTLFQLMSDMHLEICDWDPMGYTAEAPNLMLAGDIGVPGSPRFVKFLTTVSAAHERVFVISGNHEFYGLTVVEADMAMQVMCTFCNVTFLNNSTFDLPDGVRVVGTTLWSSVSVEQRSDVSCFIADHRMISGWNVTRNNERHERDVTFLRSEITRARSDGVKLVIMTHHAPLSTGTGQPCHQNSSLSSAFHTDLSTLMGPPVSLWCFGHTHHCSSQVVNGTHVASNQRGYVTSHRREDEAFRPCRTYVVD